MAAVEADCGFWGRRVLIWGLVGWKGLVGECSVEDFRCVGLSIVLRFTIALSIVGVAIDGFSDIEISGYDLLVVCGWINDRFDTGCLVLMKFMIDSFFVVTLVRFQLGIG